MKTPGPVVRLACWGDDHRNPHIWWRSVLVRNKLRRSLRMPFDARLRSKSDDPAWRKNWPWAIIDSGLSVPYKPLFAELLSDTFGWQTVFPVSTRLFAMRIGPRGFELAIEDGDGDIHAPKHLSWLGVFSDKDSVLSYARASNQPITCI